MRKQDLWNVRKRLGHQKAKAREKFFTIRRQYLLLTIIDIKYKIIKMIGAFLFKNNVQALKCCLSKRRFL